MCTAVKYSLNKYQHPDHVVIVGAIIHAGCISVSLSGASGLKRESELESAAKASENDAKMNCSPRVTAVPNPGTPPQTAENSDACDGTEERASSMQTQASAGTLSGVQDQLERAELRNELISACLKRVCNASEKSRQMMQWLHENPEAEANVLQQKMTQLQE